MPVCVQNVVLCYIALLLPLLFTLARDISERTCYKNPIWRVSHKANRGGLCLGATAAVPFQGEN